MKCRNCKRTIEDNSIFCNWCGAKQIKDRNEYTIPEPVKRSNYYSGRMVVNGKKITVKGNTRKEYFQNATDIKNGKEPEKITPTLKACIEDYISSNSKTLSPSTLRGYDYILKKRFSSAMLQPVDAIDWQKAINTDAEKYKPKTVKNSWGLVTASLNYAGYNIPNVNLPAVPVPETQFLDHKQIIEFLDAIEGDIAELPALLALHSLRASEMYHLAREDITDNTIRVHGATVRDKTGIWIDKETNKNATSTRDIPIILPRILKLLPESGKVVTVPQETVRQHLIRVCKKNNLPVCSLHDLRRSYSSLSAYLKLHEEYVCKTGGWQLGSPIVHKVYIKISDATIQEDAEKMKNYLKTTD